MFIEFTCTAYWVPSDVKKDNVWTYKNTIYWIKSLKKVLFIYSYFEHFVFMTTVCFLCNVYIICMTNIPGCVFKYANGQVYIYI